MDFETKLYSAGIPLAATVHIPGWKWNPEGAVKVPDGDAFSGAKYPMVVFCHGGSRHRNDGFGRFAEVLAGYGIASIRFDFRGCGEQAHRRYALLSASEMPYDAKCAIDFCESLPFVDRARIGMTGVSMGGIMTVRMAGGGEDRIKSAVTMSAVATVLKGRSGHHFGQENYERIESTLREDARISAATGPSRIVNRISLMGRQGPEVADANVLDELTVPGNNGYISLEGFRDGNKRNAVKYARNVHCPMFVVHGEEDGLVPVQDAYDIFNALPADNPNKRIKIYPGVGHNIPIDRNRETVFKDIADWFVETL